MNYHLPNSKTHVHDDSDEELDVTREILVQTDDEYESGATTSEVSHFDIRFLLNN